MIKQIANKGLLALNNKFSCKKDKTTPDYKHIEALVVA
jgi:hypothetical protein